MTVTMSRSRIIINILAPLSFGLLITPSKKKAKDVIQFICVVKHNCQLKNVSIYSSSSLSRDTFMPLIHFLVFDYLWSINASSHISCRENRILMIFANEVNRTLM